MSSEKAAKSTLADADASPAPDSPTDLTMSSIRRALVRTGRQFLDDECPDSAASLTYYGVLSLFPAILVMVALLGVFGKKEPTTDMVLRIVADLLPPSAFETVRSPIEQLVDSSRADFALAVGLTVALWSASRYVAAFGRAMNRIYEVDEPRPVWARIPRQLALTVSVLILAATVALMLVVSGPLAAAIGRAIGFGELALALWNIARWPVVLVCVGAAVALLYHSTPNVRQPGFRWLSIGAATAIMLWVTASLGFAFYASQFGRFNETYGALAGVIVFLLWLWITNLALLFGAELNAELARARRLQADGRLGAPA